MLKDRRVLMEQEIVNLKKALGAMYFEAVIHQSTLARPAYENGLEHLSMLSAELTVINQMIEDGHQ